MLGSRVRSRAEVDAADVHVRSFRRPYGLIGCSWADRRWSRSPVDSTTVDVWAVRAAIPVAGAEISKARANSARGAPGFRSAGIARRPPGAANRPRPLRPRRAPACQPVGACRSATSLVALVTRRSHGRPASTPAPTCSCQFGPGWCTRSAKPSGEPTSSCWRHRYC